MISLLELLEIKKINKRIKLIKQSRSPNPGYADFYFFQLGEYHIQVLQYKTRYQSQNVLNISVPNDEKIKIKILLDYLNELKIPYERADNAMAMSIIISKVYFEIPD